MQSTGILEIRLVDIYNTVILYSLLLSFLGAIANRNSFIENVWPLAITNISCIGSEESLLQCSFSLQSISSCDAQSDASVICQSNVCPW